MQQYLFRGKRKDNGKWATGCLVSTSPDEAFILIGVTGHIKRDDYECYMLPVIPETVGHALGCKDKNNKIVFVGDIIKFLYEDQVRIEPVVSYAPIITYVGRECNFYAHFLFSTTHPFHAEVIGNIHDVNPTSGQAGINHMQDPNLQAASTENQEAIKEQVAEGQEANNLESAQQDAATGADEEVTEG